MNDMSFLMIQTMISINMPGIVQQIQGAMLNFIYMDLLKTDQWLPQLLFSEEELEDDEGLNFYFDINGYSSRKIMINLGSTLIFILLAPLGIILYGILKALERFTKRLERIREKLGNSLYWNSTSRFVLQQFTPIVLSSTINLLYLNTNSFFNSFGIFLAFSLLFIAAFSLISFTYKIYMRDKDEPFSSLKFDIAFKPLLEGVKLNSTMKNNVALYWNILVLVRWVITILVLVFLRNHVTFQIQLLILVSIIVQILVSIFRPFAEPLDNYASIANEFMVTAYLYILIGLTDMAPDHQHREELGFALLGTVFMSAFANFLKLFYVFGAMAYQSWRIRSLKKQRQIRKEQYLNAHQKKYTLDSNLNIERAGTETPLQFDGEVTSFAQFASGTAVPLKSNRRVLRILTVSLPREQAKELEKIGINDRVLL
ncbi:hypothetical protein FGO68_gene10524 [Halteria grandinella]|uniref:TRP C-terminal domain-containing protein n=1 Tax=Halteria grandinella TaxID=5974 RepID=A0A8J8P5S1_HALGN|nr:hypothetical protein FGO68_gene10524 [Halteria grandinella]